MTEKFVIQIKKMFRRGVFYSVKIELYKVLYDEKYSKSQIRKHANKLITFLAKNTNLNQPKFILKTLDINIKSFAQLKQDLFVLSMLNSRKGGFFIEIGAGDGITFSNSYLLEKHFNWHGILVEPNKTFYKSCLASRKCQIINKILIESPSNKVKFYEKSIGEFSHSEGFGDVNASEIKSHYFVETIKFDELFSTSDVSIDFLSIDTEGSELEILNSINLSKYKPTIICIEHNFEKTKRIYFKKYLSKYGYSLMYSGISRWDSWFVLKSNV